MSVETTTLTTTPTKHSHHKQLPKSVSSSLTSKLVNNLSPTTASVNLDEFKAVS